MNETIIFPNLHITLENVGKTFTVFGIDIAYYGLIIAIGMLLGVALILHEAKRCGKNEDDYLDLCIYTIIFAVIGARLYYVIFSWDLYRDNLLNIFNTNFTLSFIVLNDNFIQKFMIIFFKDINGFKRIKIKANMSLIFIYIL